MSILPLLTKEHVASIREVQRNPSKALRDLTRVVRGSKTIGFFLSNEEFLELLEDMETLGSTALKARVRVARRAIAASTKTVSLADALQRYGV
jgi:hypothetical protein